MLIGVTPFFDPSLDQLRAGIARNAPRFPDRTQYNLQYSDELVDLIIGLLQKDPKQRLGTKGGFREILSHPWFAEVDHEALLKQELQSPCKKYIEAELQTDYLNLQVDPSTLKESDVPAHKQQEVKERWQ